MPDNIMALQARRSFKYHPNAGIDMPFILPTQSRSRDYVAVRIHQYRCLLSRATFRT